MRDILNRLAILAVAAFALSSCVKYDDGKDVIIGESGANPAISTTIMPSCRIESPSVSRAKELGFTVRSLIDQITTKQLDSNFLRIDEDIKDNLDGKYTFTGNEPNSPYLTNWNKAYVLEATIISSPDNTENIHYRSVSLAPDQQYSMFIERRQEGENVIADTTRFYHTRMVGWYPKNCKLPTDDGKPVTTYFSAWSDFDAVRINEQVDTNNDGVAEDIIGVHFKNFNGETDIMVSNVCEGQAWHKYNESEPHKSDIHPNDKSNIYRSPFGHNFYSPVYSNFFTYRHYRSAVRVTAFADQSAQCLSMWGEIQDVIIRNQPTSCKIWLPTELGQFGQVYEWGDRRNLPIVRTAMFGDDSNHPEYHEVANYPISMEGSSLKNDLYLGYSLIEPHKDLELEVHTLSGVYTTVIKAHHIHEYPDKESEEIDLFEPGYIYHITLNFQTTGTISAILEKEGDERYYDLSLLHEYEMSSEDDAQNSVEVFKIANCYVIDPTVMKVKDANGNHILDENGKKIPWDGYCFLASIVGNGQAGIISQGAQKFYPERETISPVSAHLLWESDLGLVTNVELKYGYVRFKVPKGESARGNAVIAVYDENEKILWSWHIWITDTLTPVEIQLGSGEHHTITILDRNLGATKATCTNGNEALETYGLYYQWGRKDPSMGPEEFDYKKFNLITAPYYDYSSDMKTAAEVAQFPEPTLKDAIENPMYLILPTAQTENYSFNWLHERYDFLWGYNVATGMTSKTIYDPCPYGYRVPSSELNHIFTDSSGEHTEEQDYGYTITFGTKKLFFPYAGYKGVDVGMTSVSLPWKYVGEKGDYQSSMYCTETDDYIGEISHFMHRERIYISKYDSWNELNIGTYNGYMIPCYANRRTAAPVRCVRDAMIGSITGSITVDAATLEPGGQVNLQYNAHSYGSAIDRTEVRALYTTTSGVPETRTLRETTYVGVYNIEDTVPFHIPQNVNDEGITFRLIVTNEHGLSYSDDTELVKTVIRPVFLQMNDVTSGSKVEYAIVGQKIRYYVGVSSSSQPTSVTIDGKPATELTDYNVVPRPDGSEAYRTVWYIDWSSNTREVYAMNVTVVVGDTTVTNEVGKVKVASLVLEANTTSLTNGALYVFKNRAFSSTYLTAVNDNLAANTSQNYYNLFMVNNNKIVSVARGMQLKSSDSDNSNITFDATGTDYTFATQDNSYVRISYTYTSGWWNTVTNYIRESSEQTVQSSTSTDNYRSDWQVYPVTRYDVPTE